MILSTSLNPPTDDPYWGIATGKLLTNAERAELMASPKLLREAAAVLEHQAEFNDTISSRWPMAQQRENWSLITRSRQLYERADRLERPITAATCAHPEPRIVESRGNWPTDTTTVRYHCLECGASWEREYLPAQDIADR